MYKNMTKVIVTNKTSKQLTVLNRVIEPTTQPQVFYVPNAPYFKQLIKAAGWDLVTVEIVTAHKKSLEAKAKDTQKVPSLLIELELAKATEDALLAIGVETIEQLTSMTEQEVLEVKGIKDKGLESIKAKLKQHNLTLLGAE